jgi:hypothetical protein
MLFRSLSGFLFAGVLVLSPSCAKKPPTGGPGTYRGVLAGVSEIGIVDVTVEAAEIGPLPASGTLSIGGTVMSLSGSLDQSKSTLSLSSTEGYKLTGDSRPAYSSGTYEDPQGGLGNFGLFLVTADPSSVQLLCGSFVWTAPTGTSPTAFAAAVTPAGAAMCVGPGIAWVGTVNSSGNLVCQQGGGLIGGNVNADGGNKWGLGVDNDGNGNWGTWTVAPCGSGVAGGGVDAGVDSAPDSAVDSAAADAEIPDGPVPVVDAAADSPVAVVDAAADSPVVVVDATPDSALLTADASVD